MIKRKPLGKAKKSKGQFLGVTITGKTKPRPSCKYCWGRGYVGRDTETGNFVPCRCTDRKVKENK